MSTLPKFFKEFNGGKEAFEAAGHHITYASNVVILKGDSAKGEAPCIFTRGMYFPNAESLIAALAFVKGIQINGVNYNAAAGGGYVKFEAADPATVVYVEKDGVKIGLSSAFVEAHNQVIADVAAIKGDYLKASDRQALEKAISDGDAAMKSYVDAEIAKVATSESFTALEGRVATLEGEMDAVEGRLNTLEQTTIPALEQSIATEKGRIDVLAPKVDTLIGSDANMSARAIVQDEVAKQLQSENISESFDTLKEMAEYLSSHPKTVEDINSAIKQNADDIDAIEKELENLATSENLGALEVRVKANEDAVATVDTRISTAVSAAEGRVDVKLGDYAKTADVNTELAKKANAADMETALGKKADKSELSNYQTVAGLTTVLAPYAKTEDVNAELAKKANASALNDYYKKTETYSQTEINNKFSGVYTKTEADGKFAVKSEMETALAGKVDNATLNGYYTKEQVDGIVDDLAVANNVYTKGETDNLLAAKANAADVYTKTEANGLLANKANAADVFTKAEVEAMFAWETIA